LHASAWIEESVRYYEEVVIAPSSSEDENEQEPYTEEEEDRHSETTKDSSEDFSIDDALETPVVHYVWRHSLDDGASTKLPDSEGRAAVNWQMTPVNPSLVNHNDLEVESLQRAFKGMETDKQIILSDFGDNSHSIFLLQPVFQEISVHEEEEQEATEQQEGDIVGYFKAKLPWDTFFQSLLPQGKGGIQVVVKNSCGHAVTYQLDGPIAYVVGDGDIHDQEFEGMGVTEEFDPLQVLKDRTSGCEYDISIFPTDLYREGYNTNKPALYSAISHIIRCWRLHVLRLVSSEASGATHFGCDAVQCHCELTLPRQCPRSSAGWRVHLQQPPG